MGEKRRTQDTRFPWPWASPLPWLWSSWQQKETLLPRWPRCACLSHRKSEAMLFSLRFQRADLFTPSHQLMKTSVAHYTFWSPLKGTHNLLQSGLYVTFCTNETVGNAFRKQFLASLCFGFLWWSDDSVPEHCNMPNILHVISGGYRNTPPNAAMNLSWGYPEVPSSSSLEEGDFGLQWEIQEQA